MNICFIGYRCTGKTTISKLLARRTGWSRFEIDNLIERELKMDIPSIIDKFGWAYFRKVEREMISTYSNQTRQIIDLGGGAVLHTKEMERLHTNSVFIFLTTSKETILKRLNSSFDRPALTAMKQEEEIDKVLTERLPLYLKNADIILNTEYLSVSQTIGVLSARLARKGLKIKKTTKHSNRDYCSA